jgi:hypothetical protein
MASLPTFDLHLRGRPHSSVMGLFAPAGLPRDTGATVN